MAAASILDLSMDFRRELLRREARASGQIVKAFGSAYQQIQQDLGKVTREIKLARDAGSTVNRSWLIRQSRLSTLARQTERHIAEFSKTAGGVILNGQAEAVDQAIRNAAKYGRRGIALSDSIGVSTTWDRVPAEALSNLVGTLQNGSPLQEVLQAFGPAAAEHASETLIKGVSLGSNPRETARQMREALGGNLTTALRIARTEQMRSYRSASVANFAANEDVVRGWVWTAALDERTCPVCIAMHGTEFEVGDDFESHPNCRCTPRPLIKGLEQKDQTGPEWFDAQPESVQLEVLGPSKLAAYQSGDITLQDLVVKTQSEAWGAGRREASLADALDSAKKAA